MPYDADGNLVGAPTTGGKYDADGNPIGGQPQGPQGSSSTPLSIAGHFVKGLANPLLGMGEMAYDFGKTAIGSGLGPTKESSQALADKYVTGPMLEQSDKAAEAEQAGRGGEGVARNLMAGLPLMGPALANWAESVGGATGAGDYNTLAERAGEAVSPEVLPRAARAGGEAVRSTGRALANAGEVLKNTPRQLTPLDSMVAAGGATIPGAAPVAGAYGAFRAARNLGEGIRNTKVQRAAKGAAKGTVGVESSVPVDAAVARLRALQDMNNVGSSTGATPQGPQAPLPEVSATGFQANVPNLPPPPPSVSSTGSAPAAPVPQLPPPPMGATPPSPTTSTMPSMSVEAPAMPPPEALPPPPAPRAAAPAGRSSQLAHRPLPLAERMKLKGAEPYRDARAQATKALREIDKAERTKGAPAPDEAIPVQDLAKRTSGAPVEGNTTLPDDYAPDTLSSMQTLAGKGPDGLTTSKLPNGQTLVVWRKGGKVTDGAIITKEGLLADRVRGGRIDPALAGDGMSHIMHHLYDLNVKVSPGSMSPGALKSWQRFGAKPRAPK